MKINFSSTLGGSQKWSKCSNNIRAKSLSRDFKKTPKKTAPQNSQKYFTP
jgi:hypothetical protein